MTTNLLIIACCILATALGLLFTVTVKYKKKIKTLERRIARYEPADHDSAVAKPVDMTDDELTRRGRQLRDAGAWGVPCDHPGLGRNVAPDKLEPAGSR